jgi:HK97 gp10 family phage protein
MLTLRVEFDPGPWKEGLRQLRHAVDDGLEKALRATSRAVRDEAKSSHSYEDRTGTLTRSIRVLPTEGRFSRGDLAGGVVATARYASFVEEGTSRARAYQYLGTAWVLQRDEAVRRVNDALEAAVDKSGLR